MNHYLAILMYTLACRCIHNSDWYIVAGITPSSGQGFEDVHPDDVVMLVQVAIQKCIEKEALCNEFYLQLIKQTTEQPGQ